MGFFFNNDLDDEIDEATDKYEEAVDLYKSYKYKLMGHYSAIKRNSLKVADYIIKINNDKKILKEMCSNQKAMNKMLDSEKEIVNSYQKLLKPISTQSAKEALQQPELSSNRSKLENIVAAAILGPIGYLMLNKSSKENDLYEIQSARADVLQQARNLKNRIVTAKKKQNQLKEKEKICKIILQKIEWYKKNFTNHNK